MVVTCEFCDGIVDYNLLFALTIIKARVASLMWCMKVVRSRVTMMRQRAVGVLHVHCDVADVLHCWNCCSSSSKWHVLHRCSCSSRSKYTLNHCNITFILQLFIAPAYVYFSCRLVLVVPMSQSSMFICFITSQCSFIYGAMALPPNVLPPTNCAPTATITPSCDYDDWWPTHRAHLLDHPLTEFWLHGCLFFYYLFCWLCLETNQSGCLFMRNSAL